jgi:hypothetical protein
MGNRQHDLLIRFMAHIASIVNKMAIERNKTFEYSFLLSLPHFAGFGNVE